jgi:hypothetical protein
VSFQEKSAAAMTGALVVVYGAYFAVVALLAWVLAELTEGAARMVLYRRGG